MTAYRGFDVLTTRMNYIEDPQDGFNRKVYQVVPATGRRYDSVKDSAPKITHNYSWLCKNQVEIAGLRNFINARCGRLVPLWIPSWRVDLVSYELGRSSDSQLSIQGVGYSAFAFTHKGRRNIQIQVGSSYLYRRVTNAEDQGTKEVLYLDSTLGIDVPPGSIISYLQFCRLNIDSIKLTHHALGVASCKLEFIEVPEEVP